MEGQKQRSRDRPDCRSDTFNSRRSGGRLAFHALEPPHEHFRHHGTRDCDRLGGVAVQAQLVRRFPPPWFVEVAALQACRM